MKKGFTLIELLVVVLIIGILSAVALPQYTKAVNRAKAVEAWTVMNAIANAQEIYYLANDKFGSREELDIEIPKMKNWELQSFWGGNTNFFITLYGKGNLSEYRLTYFRDLDEGSSSYPRRILCEWDPKICKHLIPCLDIGTTTGAVCYP